MKHNIKKGVEILCCSYTMMILFFIFSGEDIAPHLNRTTLWQTFIICLSCTLSVLLITKLELKRQWMLHISTYVMLIICIFGIGSYVFGLIPFDPMIFLAILFFTFCIYIVCWFCFFTKNKNDAKYINQQLQDRRKVKSHE